MRVTKRGIARTTSTIRSALQSRRIFTIRSQRRRRTAVAALAAVTTALLPAVPARASVSRPGSSTSATAPSLDAPRYSSPALADPTSPAGDVPELRTRTSRTVITPEGYYKAEVFTGSINYMNGSGRWEPIDNTLVPSSRPGYAYENKANAYSVQFPIDIAAAPIIVERGDQWVSLSMPGARGTVAASGADARYAQVFPGVDATFSAANDQVKELLTLAHPSATNRFVW